MTTTKKTRWQIVSTLLDGSQPVKMEIYNTKKAAVWNCELLQERVSKYLYKVVKI